VLDSGEARGGGGSRGVRRRRQRCSSMAGRCGAKEEAALASGGGKGVGRRGSLARLVGLDHWVQ
jgi:hypothetical protein